MGVITTKSMYQKQIGAQKCNVACWEKKHENANCSDHGGRVIK